ncbi:MAG TPA: efflux RND transporter periplasmic adaptor subunit, partial [Bryobacteraceae bacterium]|nr:efflux RND transporter periplasmic adaptor subunit [Bryobacteraceae bacterium]
DKLDPRVIPDLSVSVDVEVESEDKAPVAPLASVHQDGSSQKPYVFVKNGEEWQKREVELGISNNMMVVVRSGLRPGEVVAIARPPILDKDQV